MDGRGAGDEQVFGEERLRLEGGVVDRQAEHREIHLAAGSQLEQTRGGVFVDDDFDAGKFHAEFRDDRR